jgi:hypothetical protein
MTSFLSVMQYQVTAGVAFAAILHSIGGSITATIVAGLGISPPSSDSAGRLSCGMRRMEALCTAPSVT